MHNTLLLWNAGSFKTWELIQFFLEKNLRNFFMKSNKLGNCMSWFWLKHSWCQPIPGFRIWGMMGTGRGREIIVSSFLILGVRRDQAKFQNSPSPSSLPSHLLLQTFFFYLVAFVPVPCSLQPVSSQDIIYESELPVCSPPNIKSECPWLTAVNHS